LPALIAGWAICVASALKSFCSWGSILRKELIVSFRPATCTVVETFATSTPFVFFIDHTNDGLHITGVKWYFMRPKPCHK
jgi:hypothetical protein